MNVRCSGPEDLDRIFEFYDQAARLQRTIGGVVVWPDFDRGMVEEEVKQGLHFQLLEDGRIACIWALALSDEAIWEERDQGDAIYLHRIATHPDFRGRRLIHKVVEWAIAHARKIGMKYVRLDTLGDNERLIRHYQDAGFEFLGMFPISDTSSLPAHYREAPVCLFQLDVNTPD